MKPVLTGALSEHIDLKKIAESVKDEPIVFTPHSDILAVAALMSRASLFMGIDSGAMHLAAALKTPIIALFGPTDPQQIGPQPLKNHVVIKKPLMDYITVDEVKKTIDVFLKRK